MDQLRTDLRWAWRTLRRNPGPSTVVVLSLALAIGGVTAVFSFVDGVLLRPLAVADLDRVVRVRENLADPGREPVLRGVDLVTFQHWRRENHVFTGLAAAHFLTQSLTGEGDAEEIHGAEVSANLFRVLGVRPLAGRDFLPEEEAPGHNPTVIMGEDLWRRRFGADPQILGKALRLNGVRRTVVGLMPHGLRHPYLAEVWVPLVLDEAARQRIGSGLYVPARLAPGMTLARAEREMTELTAQLQRERQLPLGPRGARLVPLRTELLRGLDSLLLSLLAGALFVLLIACANVANLLLAQGHRQSAEAAVRVALGAGGRRLLVPFLAQSLLLALLGGALGVLLAAVGIAPISALSPISTVSISELGTEVRIDLPTLGFCLAITTLVGLGLGLVPALRAYRMSPQEALRGAGRTVGLGRRGRHFTGALVVGEVAIAAVLLVCAHLVAGSFARLRDTPWGLEPRGLLALDLGLERARFPDHASRVRFLEEAVARVQALPGVADAGATSAQPFSDSVDTFTFDVPGQPAPDPPGYYSTFHRVVTPRYLQTMRIRLLEGRGFTAQDDPRRGGGGVVVISKSFAERFWPGRSPLGKRLRADRLAPAAPWLTVVGVVADLPVETADPYLNMNNVKTTWYLPYTLADFDAFTLVVRTHGQPEALAPEVRGVLRDLDRDQPVARVATMEERIGDYLSRERFSALLYGSFGVLGLILAIVGIYGVMSFFVSQQSREIGIRMAMGARPVEIRNMVLRQAFQLAGLGLVLGIAAALALRRFIASLLVGIGPTDPAVIGSVMLMVVAAALLAGYVPARRAARLDPMWVIRQT
jgi:putative ABC transport system permease protein